MGFPKFYYNKVLAKKKTLSAYLNKISTQEVNVMNTYFPLSKNEMIFQWQFSLYFGIIVYLCFCS